MKSGQKYFTSEKTRSHYNTQQEEMWKKERERENKSKNKNFKWNEENAYEVHWRLKETTNIKDVDAKHMTHSYNEIEGK